MDITQIEFQLRLLNETMEKILKELKEMNS